MSTVTLSARAQYALDFLATAGISLGLTFPSAMFFF